MLREALVCLMSVCAAQAVDSTLLKTSKDPQVLMRTAVDCAQSRDATDWNALLEALGSSSFLSRLDNNDDYLGPPQQLRLAKVVGALMENRAAHGTLVALTEKPAFTSFEPRQELLIRALAAVRPAPEAAIRFWNSQSMPDSAYLHVTMDALADNHSEPALALLEKKFADRRFEAEDKIAWMRGPILRNRTDPTLLRACEQMLTKTLPSALRSRLVEALTDYHREWYRSEHPPRPPDLGAAPSEARVELRKICDYALKEVRLAPTQATAVRRTLTELTKTEPHSEPSRL
jgi:hypothetical protein